MINMCVYIYTYVYRHHIYSANICVVTAHSYILYHNIYICEYININDGARG